MAILNLKDGMQIEEMRGAAYAAKGAIENLVWHKLHRPLWEILCWELRDGLHNQMQREVQ